MNEPATKQWLGGILDLPGSPRRDVVRSIRPTTRRSSASIPANGRGLGDLLQRGLLRNRGGRRTTRLGFGSKVWNGLLPVDGVDYRRRTVQRETIRPRDVSDGIGRTVLLVENAGKPICYRDGRRADCHITRFRWASPTIWMTLNDVCRGQQLMNCHNNSQPYSFHNGGINQRVCRRRRSVAIGAGGAGYLRLGHHAGGRRLTLAQSLTWGSHPACHAPRRPRGPDASAT